jgi:hypothetical protein
MTEALERHGWPERRIRKIWVKIGSELSGTLGALTQDYVRLSAQGISEHVGRRASDRRRPRKSSLAKAGGRVNSLPTVAAATAVTIVIAPASLGDVVERCREEVRERCLLGPCRLS